MNNNQKDILNEENEVIDLKDIYFTLHNNYKLFLSIICSFIIFSIIYIYCSIPLYESYSSILIESNSKNLSLFSELGIGDNKNIIDNEVEILRSSNTIDRVLEEFIKTGEYKNMYLFRTKEYNIPRINKFFRGLFLVNYFSKNHPVDIEDNYKRKLLIKDLKDRLNINKVRKTDVIQISLLTPDPNESALVINRLIKSYQNIDKEWNNGEMIHMRTFLDSQISVKERELNSVESNLSTFQKEEEIYGLDGNADLLLKQLTSIESDYYANKAQENILKERKRYLYNELTEKEKLLADEVANTIKGRLQILQNELSQKEADLKTTIALQGEDHPAVITEGKKIKILTGVVKEQTQEHIKQGILTADPLEYRQALMDTILALEAHEALLASKSTELNKLVKKYEIELSSLPDKSLKFARLERERNILSETYSLMMQKREEAKIREASQLGKIRIVDLASPEIIPIKPNKTVIFIIFILLGGIIGFLICFLKEYLDNSIKSIHEIERYNLEILAMIPTISTRYDNDQENERDTKKLERRLITHEDSKSPVSEAYRTLRTNLIYRANQDQGNAILVSSPGPGEGKTTTISNLAITFANLGKRTLLVDTDLRKPVMHTVFNKKQTPGLTDYLMGRETQVENLVNELDIKNLNLMTSGSVPPFPSELLGSSKMNDLIKELKNNWDIVLFDLPPLMAVTDAYVILKEMDQFLLVLRAGVTQKGALKRSIAYLEVAGISETGVVINQIDKSKTSKDEHFDYYADYYGIEEE